MAELDLAEAVAIAGRWKQVFAAFAKISDVLDKASTVEMQATARAAPILANTFDFINIVRRRRK